MFDENTNNTKEYSFQLSHCPTEYGVAYGLVCRNGEEQLASYPDISPDKSFVKAVVSFCNDAQPTLEELPDILEGLLQ